jgi:serine/threonine protein kinase
MGTPAFMAPEQARGEPADERTDVFALGAILYFVLCGKAPYGGRSALDTLRSAIAGVVAPLRERAPGLHPRS